MNRLRLRAPGFPLLSKGSWTHHNMYSSNIQQGPLCSPSLATAYCSFIAAHLCIPRRTENAKSSVNPPDHRRLVLQRLQNRHLMLLYLLGDWRCVCVLCRRSARWPWSRKMRLSVLWTALRLNFLTWSCCGLQRAALPSSVSILDQSSAKGFTHSVFVTLTSTAP